MANKTRAQSLKKWMGEKLFGKKFNPAELKKEYTEAEFIKLMKDNDAAIKKSFDSKPAKARMHPKNPLLQKRKHLQKMIKEADFD